MYINTLEPSRPVHMRRHDHLPMWYNVRAQGRDNGSWNRADAGLYNYWADLFKIKFIGTVFACNMQRHGHLPMGV